MASYSRLGKIIGATKKFAGAVSGSTARAQAEEAARLQKKAAKLKKQKLKLKKQKKQKRQDKIRREAEEYQQSQQQPQGQPQPKKKKPEKLSEHVEEQQKKKKKKKTGFQLNKRTKEQGKYAQKSGKKLDDWALANGLKPRGQNVWDNPEKVKKFVAKMDAQGKLYGPTGDKKPLSELSEMAQRGHLFKHKMRQMFSQEGRPWYQHPDVKFMRGLNATAQKRYKLEMPSQIPGRSQKKNYLPR